MTCWSLVGSLSVLATSRSPVGGSDESVYQLPPLPVDGRDQRDAGAVRLFLDRAGSAAPAATFSDDERATVARICRRLDGLPLAIELAAARVRHLSLAELAERLDEGFGPLDRAGPDTRHRTLETAFDWTWDLLDDDERSVLSRLAALPRTFDLHLAETVAGAGSGEVVLRLLDRSLVSPTARVSDPRRFRLLASLRAIVLERTDPAVVEEVRRTHAGYHAALADQLRRRARTDDSRAAAEQARRLCPEVNAAIDWAMPTAPELVAADGPRAVRRRRAVRPRHQQPRVDRARRPRPAGPRARNPQPTFSTSASPLCYDDLALVADLSSLALERVGDDTSELAARHLAGYADAYRQDTGSALAHLEVAEALADELLDMWQLASVRQAKGIALRNLGDSAAAVAAFESAMRTYALAGDAMHVNNARYMMAAAAADSGLNADEAIQWAEQCVAYARGRGNRHELAHAMLTRAALVPGPDVDADLFEAVDTFRTVGDLRCLARGYLRLAARRTSPDEIALLGLALDVARRANDVANQATALEQLVRAHWESGAERDAATTFGELVGLVGPEAATARCPQGLVDQLDHWRTAVAEGQARAHTPR